MADKSFQYYADQAESIIVQAFETGRPSMLEQQKVMVAAADVYARLAAAAPKRDERQLCR